MQFGQFFHLLYSKKWVILSAIIMTLLNIVLIKVHKSIKADDGSSWPLLTLFFFIEFIFL